MKVLDSEYFGNLTLKGMSEISTDFNFDYLPIAWGWYVIVIFIFVYIFLQKLKKNEIAKKNKFIYDYIKIISNKDTDLYKLSKILHITHKRKNIAKDSELSFYSTNNGRNISNYLYQSIEMPHEELEVLKKSAISWLKERVL